MAPLLSSLSNYPKLLTKGFLDLLFPPRCILCKKNTQDTEICIECLGNFETLSSPLCSICGTGFNTHFDKDHPCGFCIKNKPSFDRAASIFSYDENIKEAIHLFKYKGKTILSGSLGKSLVKHCLAKEGYDAILPVPLHIKRLRQRGYNQSQLLAVELGRERGVKVEPWLLQRVHPTLSQTGMKRKERVENLRGAFKLRKNADVEGMSLLLIDDVYTTGSTAMECARVLKKGGAKKVNVLTLARTAKM